LSSKAGWPELRALGRRLHHVRYDAVLDIHKNFRSRYLAHAAKPQRILRHRKHVFRRWILVHTKINLMQAVPPIYQRYLGAAAPLGIAANRGRRLELFWREQDERAADSALAAQGWQTHVPLIALAPGAGYFTKRWPAEYFGQLAAHLLLTGNQVVLLGGPQDIELGKMVGNEIKRLGVSSSEQTIAGTNGDSYTEGRLINLIGSLSLLTTAAVIKRSRLLAANDSGLMHIAEAVGTPVMAIFGSTVRELGFFPQNASSRVVENRALSCRPCSHLGHDQCPRGHFRCMREILPANVSAIVHEMLSVHNSEPSPKVFI
jgi:heptosyltransferase-2